MTTHACLTVPHFRQGSSFVRVAGAPSLGTPHNARAPHPAQLASANDTGTRMAALTVEVGEAVVPGVGVVSRGPAVDGRLVVGA